MSPQGHGEKGFHRGDQDIITHVLINKQDSDGFPFGKRNS